MANKQSDSLAKSAPRVPTSVPKLVVSLEVGEGAPHTYRAGYYFEILDAAGLTMEIRQGDLIQYLSAADKATLAALLDGYFVTAKNTIP